MKWLVTQNVASAATVNGLKNEHDPKALMVDLGLNQIQDINFDLASCARFGPLFHQFGFPQAERVHLDEKYPQRGSDGPSYFLLPFPSEVLPAVETVHYAVD